jgi:glycosyltransferase involved in cell wall biosynthesis
MDKISFIIPVYNENKTVRQAITQIVDLDYDNKEIIIIDNGSSDGSVEIIKSFSFLVNVKIILKSSNTGYGSSIKEAINISSGDYAYIQYADLEYDHFSYLEMLNRILKENLDVVFGSRLKIDMWKTTEKFKLIIRKPSYLATIICTYLINIFYKKNFTDIIGTKFYKVSSLKKIEIYSNGQGYDFELVSKLCKYNFKIGEIFVNYIPRKNSNEKKIKFYHMFVALFQILKVKIFH